MSKILMMGGKAMSSGEDKNKSKEMRKGCSKECVQK